MRVQYPSNGCSKEGRITAGCNAGKKEYDCARALHCGRLRLLLSETAHCTMEVWGRGLFSGVRMDAAASFGERHGESRTVAYDETR